jgi:Coenzyme PQQ synthesis protein D (PqqD)
MRFRRASGVIHEQLDGHAVLLDPDAVRMLTLNRVGTLVWELLDHDRTGTELVALLLPEVRGVTVEQLEADVASYLDELVALGVVLASDEPS